MVCEAGYATIKAHCRKVKGAKPKPARIAKVTKKMMKNAYIAAKVLAGGRKKSGYKNFADYISKIPMGVPAGPARQNKRVVFPQ